MQQVKANVFKINKECKTEVRLHGIYFLLWHLNDLFNKRHWWGTKNTNNVSVLTKMLF